MLRPNFQGALQGSFGFGPFALIDQRGGEEKLRVEEPRIDRDRLLQMSDCFTIGFFGKGGAALGKLLARLSGNASIDHVDQVRLWSTGAVGISARKSEYQVGLKQQRQIRFLLHGSVSGCVDHDLVEAALQVRE